MPDGHPFIGRRAAGLFGLALVALPPPSRSLQPAPSTSGDRGRILAARLSLHLPHSPDEPLPLGGAQELQHAGLLRDLSSHDHVRVIVNSAWTNQYHET